MQRDNSYYESVHLLRGFSAFVVLFGHNFGWYKLPAIDPAINAIRSICDLGVLGVTIFFVISGFVLPLSLTKGYALVDYHRFLAKRFIRIEPTYAVSIAISLAILLIKTRLAPNAIPYPFILNQFLAHFAYLIPFTSYDWYNTVYWTLAIEFQFYLLIALVFPIWNKGTGYAIGIACCFSCLAFLQGVLPQVGLLSKAPLFAAGMLALTALRAETSRGRYLAFFTAAIIALIHEVATDADGAGLFAIATVAVIVLWKAPVTPLRYLGTISYSLYISHYPIVFLTNQAARYYLGDEGHPLLYVVAFGNFVLTLVIAHYMYRFIEKPTQDISKKIKYKGRGHSGAPLQNT
jgi:exopolysaccharide production protein ExoZ